MNVWHFQSQGVGGVAAAATRTFGLLQTFYQTIDFAFATFCADTIRCDIYDLSDAEPRVPIDSDTIDWTPATGGAFPAEVAMCLSYRGELLSGTNPARRRGRIYLGPLDDGTGVTGNDVTVDEGARNTIIGAAQDMAESGFTGDAFWVVFSPTLAGTPPWDVGTLEDASTRVLAGYIDNAFDTMRSRGSRASVRSSWSTTVP